MPSRITTIRISIRVKAALFIDDTPDKLGSKIEGIVVTNISNFKQEFGEREHIIYLSICLPGFSVYNRCQEIRSQYKLEIVPFTDFFYEKKANSVLPFLFWGKAPVSDIQTGNYDFLRNSLADKRSIDVLDSFLKIKHKGLKYPDVIDSRTKLDFLTKSFTKEIHYVDCGAYDGDTVEDFLTLVNRQFGKITIIEPDPTNASKIHKRIEGYLSSERKKIDIFEVAIAGQEMIKKFRADSSMASAIDENGEIEVECCHLGRFLDSEKDTYIKLDIEGYELEAIIGVQDLLKRNKPKLAISVYHRPEDLIEIFKAILNSGANYSYYLRTHAYNGADTMLYCI